MFTKSYASPLLEGVDLRDILVPMGVAEICLDQPHDPCEFNLRARYPIRVSQEFVREIVLQAKPRAPTQGVIGLPYGDTPRRLHGYQIRSVLPIGHSFDPADACAIIAWLIMRQLKGTSGHMHNRGRASLFPCGQFLIGVHWVTSDKLWFIGLSKMDRLQTTHRRVFSGSLICR